MKFTKIAAIASFLTVITTLGIHAFFPNFSPEFDNRLLLYKNPIYTLNRWWIIVHCVLVLLAMWGLFEVYKTKHPSWLGFGLVFYAVFAIAEILRQFLILFYLNGLRIKYLNSANEGVKTMLKLDIENFTLLGDSLFGLFIFAFGLGNLCFGLVLFKENKLAKILGAMLIFWSIMNFTALILEFYPSEISGKIIGLLSLSFQPYVRLFIGIVLWKWANSKNKLL